MKAPRLPGLNDLTAFARLFEFRSVSRWVGLGLIIGVLAGLCAAAFFLLLEWIEHVVLHWGARFDPLKPGGERSLFEPAARGPVRTWVLALAPALGGLGSGLLVHRFCKRDLLQGTRALIGAFHRSGDARLKTAVTRSISSALVIGTGGSAGREGPIAHLGGACGVLVAKALNLPARERRLLLLAGAAGGIGAIFQSPLGAALFVLEVLYRDDFEVDAMVPTVLASVVGYSVFTMIFGEGTIFVTAESYDFHPLQLPFYLIMAVGVAIVGVLFVNVLQGAADWLFPKMPVPAMLRPMVGGLMVGLLALFVPHAIGAGYGWLQEALLPTSNLLPIGWAGAVSLLAIALAKVLTTTLTVGSGGSGGVFGPSIVIGGMVGGAFGHAFHQLVPTIVTQPGAFVLVGMAACFGGIAKAPVSTIVMASEMSGSYELLVPLMLAEVVAFAMSRRWGLYPEQVTTRRDSPAHGGEYVLDLLQDVRVRDVYDKTVRVVPVLPSTPVPELLKRASEATVAVFPVTGRGGQIDGIITLNTLRAAFVDPELQSFAIAADCAAPYVSIDPDETLGTALERFATSHYPELLVVDRSRPDEILGLLSYEDLLTAYSREVVKRRSATATIPPMSG